MALPATAATLLREIGPFDTSALNARGMLWTGYGTQALQQLYNGLPLVNPMDIGKLYVTADDYEDWWQQLMTFNLEREQLDVLVWLELQGAVHHTATPPSRQGWFVQLPASPSA